jgi:DNA helicase-2/ATP-dependent DNA helicase PcrA
VLQAAFTRFGIDTERASGRSPLEVVLRAAYRCTSREQLAAWIDTSFNEGDDLARRVAEEADRYLASGRPGSLRTWVELNDPFGDLDPTDPRDAVALLTFHAAKGREWWGVVITGAEEGLIPHGSSSSPVLLAEEARLLYVAITRAAQNLLITHCSQRQRKPVAPSRWLQAVIESTVADEPSPPPARARVPADPLIPYREWRAAIARLSGQPEQAVCSDRVLRSLALTPPAGTTELAQRLGITETAAARLRPLPA